MRDPLSFSELHDIAVLKQECEYKYDADCLPRLVDLTLSQRRHCAVHAVIESCKLSYSHQRDSPALLNHSATAICFMSATYLNTSELL